MAVVLVTGAGNGIGLALTRHLLYLGHRVAGLDLQPDRLTALEMSYPENLLAFRCDVSAEADAASAVASTSDRLGPIDIVVNNACLACFTPFERKTIDEFRREIEVNLYGALHVIRAVVPSMKARGGGVIHNVSSGIGWTGFPGLAGYTASKGALEALTRTLRLELAPFGIAVGVIHPPLTRTDSSRPLGVPQQFMADPEDVGRRLARRVGSRRARLTPDATTAAGLFLNRHFPGIMGRFLARMAERARGAAE
jgi:NAD(P)-dependent dehydrogenase (short-subunit alcohol dehydrogenase family)